MRKLKKETKYLFYGTSLVAFVGLVYSVSKTFNPVTFSKDNYEYVSKVIFEDTLPVVGDVNVLKRPYLDNDVKIITNYYDYKADNKVQEDALIFSDDTYIQSSGVSYGKGEIFDVVSILDGIVIDVYDDSLLGKVIEVRHSNDVISVYQSLSEVNYKVNDTVKQGDVIGKSGSCNVRKDLSNHVYVELIVSGSAVNIEEYYDKKLSEF